MIGKGIERGRQTESGKREDCPGGQTEQGHSVHCTRRLRNEKVRRVENTTFLFNCFKHNASRKRRRNYIKPRSCSGCRTFSSEIYFADILINCFTNGRGWS